MMHKTIQANFMARQTETYTANHYEAISISDSNPSHDESVPGKLVNNFINTYNLRQKLPKWIIIVLENDLIRNLKYEFAVESSYETVITWICNQLNAARESMRDKLPFKAKKFEFPHIIFIEPTLHRNYTDLDLRTSFLRSLKTVISRYQNIMTLRIEQDWDDNNDDYFSGREKRYTSTGLKKFWSGIDKALMYADSKVLRNHGKPLKEVFKPIQPQATRPNTTRSSPPVTGQNDHRRNNNNPRDRFSYYHPRLPTYRSSGYRLPAPHRY